VDTVCTVAVVPPHEEPLARFLRGAGTLKIARTGEGFGRSVTLWQALVDLPEAAYPLIVENHRLSRQRLLWQAAQNFRVARDHLDADSLSKLRALLLEEGWDPDFLP
jgi:hypothetical protein